MEWMKYLFGIPIGLFVYFLPTMIAIRNKKSSIFSIFLLNLFLGWTGLGWFAILIQLAV